MKLKLSLDITLQYVIYIFGVIHASSKIDEIRTCDICDSDISDIWR